MARARAPRIKVDPKTRATAVRALDAAIEAAGKTPRPPTESAERRRITALQLAIQAAPYLLPTNLDRITGAQLTAEAENIEKWLKDAKL